MIRSLPSVCAVALCVVATGVPARAQEANPLLLELRPLLQDAIGKGAPDAIWEAKGNELTASYQTRARKKPMLRPDGTTQIQDEIEPNEGGFVLRARIFSRLPAFAVQTPREIQQERWRENVARYNLRTASEFALLLPEPELTRTEMARATNDRIEFVDIPLSSPVYATLLRVDSTGLLTPSPFWRSGGKMPQRTLTRYEFGVALARLLEERPDLKGDRASRLKALQGATRKDLSAAELDALDGDLRELQAEFAGELTWLSQMVNTGVKIRGVAPRPLISFKPQYLVFTLSQGLKQNALPADALLKIVADWVEKKNKVADEK